MGNDRENDNGPLRKSATERKLAKPTEEQKLRRVQTERHFRERVKTHQDEKKYKELVSGNTQPAQINREIKDVQQDIPPAEMQARKRRLNGLLFPAAARKEQSILSADAAGNDAANDQQSQQRKQP